MPEGAAVVDPRAVGEQTKLEQLDGGLSVAQVQHEQGAADEKHRQILRPVLEIRQAALRLTLQTVVISH